MATPQTSSPYTFQRASTMATRSLVSNKPAELPSASSNDMHTDSKPILEKRHTNYYERAAAEAARTGAVPSTTASSAAATVGVQKQQSWKMSDLRAQKQVEVVEGRAYGQGYATMQK